MMSFIHTQLNRVLPFLHHFCVYSSGSILLHGTSILLTPLWIRCFSPAQYGALELLTTLQNLISFLITVNITNVLSINFFHIDHKKRPRLVQELSGTFLYLCIPTLLIIPPAGYLLGGSLLSLPSAYLLLFAASSTGLLSFFVQLFQTVLVLEKQSLHLSLSQLVYGIGLLVGTILAVTVCKAGISGVILTRFILTGLFALYAITKDSPYSLIPRMISPRTALSYCRQAGVFLPSNLALWSFSSGHQWSLAHYGMLHSAGLYAFAHKCGQLFQMVITTPLQKAYVPHLYAQYKQSNSLAAAEHMNKKVMWLFVCLLGSASVIGYYLTRPFLHFFIPSAYHSALGLLLGVALGQVFYIGAQFCLYLFFYTRNMLLQTWVLSVTSALNISIGLLLIPHAGVQGAVFASILANLSYFLLGWYYNNSLLQENDTDVVPARKFIDSPPTPIAAVPQRKEVQS